MEWVVGLLICAGAFIAALDAFMGMWGKRWRIWKRRNTRS